MNDSNELDPSLIYKNILDNMRDGVIAISSDGKIMIINAAASNILILNNDIVAGDHFTKIFSKLHDDPRNDELNDAIFQSIYESAITHHKDVNYYSGDTCKQLLMSSTVLFLKKNESKIKIGMILVFSDITERQRLVHIENLLGKYIDHHIVARLINYSEDELTKANKQKITVSFCDMNNFTALCEILPAVLTEKLMNLYFTKMSHSVQKNDGVIDKFIGDAIMAFWGAPFTEANDSVCACQSALEQVMSLEALNDEIKTLLNNEYKNINIHVGIGIATGDLIIANVGSENHKSITVMGNTVNLAARLVGANKIYGTTILITEDVVKSSGTHFEYREVDTILVKGKEISTAIYELLGIKDSLTPEKKIFLPIYAQALSLYRARQWDSAQMKFEEALSYIPSDKASQVFLERIKKFKKKPPADSWSGVWVFKNK